MKVIDKSYSGNGEIDKRSFKNWWHTGCNGVTGCFLDFNLINYDLQKHLIDIYQDVNTYSEPVEKKLTLISRAKSNVGSKYNRSNSGYTSRKVYQFTCQIDPTPTKDINDGVIDTQYVTIRLRCQKHVKAKDRTLEFLIKDNR